MLRNRTLESHGINCLVQGGQQSFRLHSHLLQLLCVAAALFICSAALHGQPSPFPRDNFWITDGPVNAITIQNDTVYLGGDFSYVGPQTGPAALFDLATGDYLNRFPRVNGTIYVLEPDGSGGWFLGGEFTQIGNVPVTYVVHVFSDLSVDRSFAPVLTGSGVYALARQGDLLFIGGQFTKVGGVAQSGIAALSTENAALQPILPQVTGRVNALLIDGQILYLGGGFTAVGSAGRNRVAAIDLQTGKATAWNPNADNAVFAMRLADELLYVGGQFTTVGAKPRNRLAALETSTGQATTWNPNPNGNVRSLEIADDNLYLGGDFTSLGIQNRNKFAAVSRSTASVLPLDLKIEGTGSQVLAIHMANNALLLSGNFGRLQSHDQPLLAAVDPATGEVLDQAPLGTLYNGASDNAVVTCFAFAGNRLACAGSFQSLGGVARTNAAALQLQSGAVLPWSVAPSSPVLAMTASSTNIYLAGAFTNVNGVSANGLVAVNPLTGALRPDFKFVATNKTAAAEIKALLFGEDRLYVGGEFSNIRSQAVRMLAKIDPATGDPSTFDAKILGGTAGVTELARSSGFLYIGGDFNSVGGQSRTRLAAINESNAQVDAWNPAPNRDVSALCTVGNRLYVGGAFTTIHGVGLRNSALYEIPAHTLMQFDPALPTAATGINAIAATETIAYYGGAFESIGGDFRRNLACLNPETALTYDWDPATPSSPRVIALSDSFIFVGGSFRTVGRAPSTYPVPNFAVYDRNPTILTHQVNNGKLVITATTGDRTRAIFQSSAALPTWSSIETNSTPGGSWKLQPTIGVQKQEFFRVIAE